MLNFYLVFAFALLLAINVVAQNKQSNSKSKTDPVEISNLAGDSIGFECEKLSKPFVGTIVDTMIPQGKKTVSFIAIQNAKKKRDNINFDDLKIEELNKSDSRKLSSLLVRGKKVEVRVVKCFIGSGPVYYADSIKGL